MADSLSSSVSSGGGATSHVPTDGKCRHGGLETAEARLAKAVDARLNCGPRGRDMRSQVATDGKRCQGHGAVKGAGSSCCPTAAAAAQPGSSTAEAAAGRSLHWAKAGEPMPGVPWPGLSPASRGAGCSSGRAPWRPCSTGLSRSAAPRASDPCAAGTDTWPSLQRRSSACFARLNSASCSCNARHFFSISCCNALYFLAAASSWCWSSSSLFKCCSQRCLASCSSLAFRAASSA
mmetsp:Transcript_115577/g.351510  ORF Transcript_115577/g.351510 Transcript_115577/m.351510 type:complete len:235 (-) Transcript_115577:1049-1753(-)